MLRNLHELLQSRFHAIDSQRRVGQRLTDAVFRETALVDSQFSQHPEDGRWFQSVTLQLDDGKLRQGAFQACGKIAKREVRVYRQSLGLRLVDEGDAMKLVLYLLLQELRVRA